MFSTLFREIDAMKKIQTLQHEKHTVIIFIESFTT